MSKAMPVTLLRSGNRMVVEPTTPEIRALLSPLLCYTAIRYLRGFEKKMARKAVEFIEYACHVDDHRGRLATSFGFYSRVSAALQARGHAVTINDMTPPADVSVFTPDWDRLFSPACDVSFRHGQEDFLAVLAAHVLERQHARFDCPPGYGKSKMIGLIATMYPKARIHVVTKRVPVLRDRIYPDLAVTVPSVGIVCGTTKITGKRVMLYSVDSLTHSLGDADIMIGDECHELAADRASEYMTRYDGSVNFGLSATHDMRGDGKDMRVEAIFGPVVYKMQYTEAQDNAMIVPIEVRWGDVQMDVDPCAFTDDSVERKRHGIWRNEVRNQRIADDARTYGADDQVLVTCETVEHLLHIKKLLPEFEIMHADSGIKPGSVEYFKRLQVWPDNFEPMTLDRRLRMTDMFEKGKLKKVIVTTVWNVGVSFNHLAVLIRADGSSSSIMNTQIPGRVSRISTGKEIGIVHDYRDTFSKALEHKAKKRSEDYATHGWTQVEV